MNLRVKLGTISILLSAFVVGCQEVGQDRPATQPQQDTEPGIAESDGLSPAATPPITKPEEAPAAAESEDPSAGEKEESSAVAVAPTPASEDVAVNLDEALKEVDQLEQDTEYFAALTRVRELMKTHRDGEEGQQLRALHQRLHRDYRTSSELGFAVRKLGEESNVAVSVATRKLLEAGEVGLVFLRKALREAEPTTALRAADVLMQQGEPQIAQLIVERMEQAPPAPLGGELGGLLQRLDEIEPEWMERLGTLAKGKGPSQAGAVSVFIDRLERSVHAQLGVDGPDDTRPGVAEKDEPASSETTPVKVDEHLVQTLYEVAETAEGPVQRRCMEALVLVLDDVNRRDGEAFNQLLGDEDAHALVGDYLLACLDSEVVEDRVWAIARAEVVGMVASGLWAQVRSQPIENPGQPVVGQVLEERLDTTLNFADLEALGKTGPVEPGQIIQWKGFVDVPTEGKYTFSVDCDGQSPTTLYVDEKQVSIDEPVELSSGWHDVRAELTLAGEEARLSVSWAGPDLEKQSIPAERLACADRTRMLIWHMGRECDLPQARDFAEQLLRSIERVDNELPAKLTALAVTDRPARPAIAAMLAEVLDYSMAHEQEPPEWELSALKVLLAVSEEIDGPERRRVVASLVNHLVGRAGSELEEFNRQGESPQAYSYVRDFIAERLETEELPVRLWAARHAEPFALLGTGLEGSYFDKDFKTRLFDRVDAKLQFEPGKFGYPDEREDNFSVRWSGLIEVPADGEYVFSCETDGTCRLWLDDQPVIRDPKKPPPVELSAGLHEIRIEYIEKTGPDRLVMYWQTPDDAQPEVLADEMQHVDRVRLLVDKLIDHPDDPQATAWLEELSYKADRLTVETIAELINLAGERETWQGPLARVAAAAILRDPRKSPAPAASLLAKYVPALNDDVRRGAVAALAVYFSAACGSDRQKFDQAAASDKTYDLLCEEVQSAADSAEAADTEWALEQAKHLGLKISTVVRQGEDGRLVLHAQVATLHGNTIKYEFDDGKDNLGFWTNAEDFASWRLAIAKGGTFDVSVTWACEDGNEGGEFVVAVADQQLTGKVAATGGWTEFQTINLGTMKLGGGTHQLTVKARAKPRERADEPPIHYPGIPEMT